MRAAGRLRREPSPGPPPGGDHLDPRAGLHLRRSRSSRPPTTSTTTTSSASPGATGPSAVHDDPASFLAAFFPSCASCSPTAGRSSSTSDELGDRMSGVMAGYLVWAGLVDRPARRPSRSSSRSCTASSARSARELVALAADARPAERAMPDLIELRGLRASGCLRRAARGARPAPAVRGRPRRGGRSRSRPAHRRPRRHRRLRRGVHQRRAVVHDGALRPARAAGRAARRRWCWPIERVRGGHRGGAQAAAPGAPAARHRRACASPAARS